jgi:tripartite ATP-independent transporter DctM subunit
MTGALIGLCVLLVLLTLGLPMVTGLLCSVALILYLSGQWGLTLPQTMIFGMSSFTMIALPLFVYAGALMNSGGISARLFDFARSLVGWMKGGLAQVDVLTSIFFGGMVGSSSADLAATGSVLIPAMKREGYSGAFAAAIGSSSAGIGPLIPPSSPAILYAAVTGTSLSALFIAGLIPGLLLGLVFMVTVGILARKHGYPSFAKFSLNEVWRAGLAASLAFGLPGLIIGGLVFGAFTPSEAGAFGAVYAGLLSLAVYRSLSLAGFYRATVVAVQMTGELLVVVALSVALGNALSAAHVPQALAGLIDWIAIGDSTFMRLLALMLLAIIAGMFIDPLIPVVVPVLLPSLIAFDIDLVHFGVLMVMAVVIGQVTPPVAMSLIITGRIARVDQIQVFRANMPFFIATVLFTILLMLVPELSTWLPEQMKD